jgi:cyclase
VPHRDDRTHFTVERVAPGVHVAIATETGFGMCNSGIVDLGGATVVFDTMLTPMAGAALARAAERCTGERPTWVVNSHWHGDHIWGTSEFPGSHVVTARRAREEILRRSQKQLDDDRRTFARELKTIDRPDSDISPADRPKVRAWFEAVIATPRTHRPVVPDVGFENGLVIEGKRRALHLLTYGGAHSPSDVFAYLPDERILFAGDLAMVGFHPSLGDGNLLAWIRTLRRMRTLRVDRLLPGHGELGSGKAIDWNLRYHLDLERQVRGALRRGLTATEATKLSIPARYRHLGFTMMFPGNLARAYAQLRPRKHARRRR